MLRNKILQILLSPFALLYGLGVGIRNFLYSREILKSVQFNIPVVNVGNLSVGGSGKTPHVEYLIKLLAPYLTTATLSRGYGRKSRGFRIIERRDSAIEAGDEPLQYKRKYPQVVVSVSESRALGIPRLLQKNSAVQVIILDDAFQHRAIRPGLSLLLTPWDKPFYNDYILPVGTLREWPTARQRADAIIVTKCPDDLLEDKTISVVDKLGFKKPIFFSKYRYGTPYYLFNGRIKLELNNDTAILLVSGIADTKYLKDQLTSKTEELYELKFKDHHTYSKFDLSQIKKTFDSINAPKKAIITTEKDAVKIESHRLFIVENKLPLFVLPIDVDFLFDNKNRFDVWIKNYLLEFKVL